MAGEIRRENFADEASWLAYLAFEHENNERKLREDLARSQMPLHTRKRLERLDRRREQELTRRRKQRERDRREIADQLINDERKRILETTYSVAEVADMLGVSIITIRKRIESGSIEVVRLPHRPHQKHIRGEGIRRIPLSAIKKVEIKPAVAPCPAPLTCVYCGYSYSDGSHKPYCSWQCVQSHRLNVWQYGF